MSHSDTTTNKQPPDITSVDLADKFMSNDDSKLSLEYDPKLHVGISEVCHSVGYNKIDNRAAMRDYYDTAPTDEQAKIILAINGPDAKAKATLLYKATLRACALNFINKAPIGTAQSDSTIKFFNTVEEFNAQAEVNRESAIFSIAQVHKALRDANSKLINDQLIKVCGSLGASYDTAKVMQEHSSLLYTEFRTEFGNGISDKSGITRGPALWFLYALAREKYENVKAYAVGDMFIATCPDTNQHPGEDLDKAVSDMGLIESNYRHFIKPEGFKLDSVSDDEDIALVPDEVFVLAKMIMLQDQQVVMDSLKAPQVLKAHLLQLAYVLNTHQHKFNVIKGMLDHLEGHIPDLSCIEGIVPSNTKVLVANNDHHGGGSYNEQKMNLIDFDSHIKKIYAAHKDNFRFFDNYPDAFFWHDNNINRLATIKSQMAQELREVVSKSLPDEWGNATYWSNVT